ncbi:serine/threonine protein kinase [Streptomyces sp. NPDC085524]|uniref:serine/threonine protein kinase n=1 Tax=Streptomyces sp. NPDC085524 TaxID=3365728 RepID=UPI0037D8E1F9
MERLRHDDPTQVGPYVPLVRLDADSDHVSGPRAVPDRRYLARTADGERTVLVCVPRVGADPSRWALEAEGARRLSVPGFLTVAEVGGTSGFPWHAAPYTPALPLPAVLAAYGGPLPEDTVRVLGAALAQTLAGAHAQGVTHAGLSPAAVLVTSSGPLLTCFGATRAERTGHDPGCLAPEQAAGAPPGPAGDLYALGAVLAYAATGHTVPEQSELPPGLRRLTAACLARDPADRPMAREALRELVLAGPSADGGPSTATALDHTGAPALPGRVVAALATQSAVLLAAELPLEQQPFAATQKVH